MKRMIAHMIKSTSLSLIATTCCFIVSFASDFTHEYVHVTVIGSYNESWLGSHEKSWVYSGAVVNVISDTLYIATSLYSTGFIEIGKNERLWNRDDEYSLVVAFSSGVVLPVDQFAFDQDSGLLYIKVFAADILTEGYDFVVLDPVDHIDATNQVVVIYFDPGDGRLRRTFEIINRIATSEPHDIWNFGNRYILENYQFNHNNNGSPILHFDNQDMQYEFVGVMLLREQNSRTDPVVIQLRSIAEMAQLDWIRVDTHCVAAVRSLNR